jgi:hypothetical protein
VVVEDCVVLWAITDRDRASTVIEVRTAANNFGDFIRFSFVTLDRYHRMIPMITNLCTIARCPLRSKATQPADGILFLIVKWPGNDFRSE